MSALTKQAAGEALSDVGMVGSGAGLAFLRVDLKGKGLADIAELGGFPHLKFVVLAANALTSLAALDKQEFLMSLDVSGNQLATIDLPAKAYLQTFNASSNQIKELGELPFPLLTLFNLTNNKLAALPALDALKSLRVIELRGNELESLEPLGACTQLEELYVAKNKLKSLGGLDGLGVLRVVHARENQIESVEGVGALQSLEYLNLRQNALPLAQKEQLGECKRLKRLNLQGNPIAEADNYRIEMCLVLPSFTALDKTAFTDDERSEAEELAAQRKAAAAAGDQDDG